MKCNIDICLYQNHNTMKTEMSFAELEVLKQTEFNGISVMDCPNKNLLPMVLVFMKMADDLSQELADAGNDQAAEEASSLYDEMDEVRLLLEDHILLSISSRNELRMLFKHLIKLSFTSMAIEN